MCCMATKEIFEKKKLNITGVSSTHALREC